VDDLTILITGFGRFPGAAFNPTEPLVAGLMRSRRPGLAGIHLIPLVFPTSYAAVDEQLPALVARHRPDAIVMFGLAGRTKGIRIEKRAANRITQVFPDVERKVPAAVISAGVGAQRGRAPFARLVAAARTSGLHAYQSRDAGHYLCNYGYWRALETDTPMVVFVHIPNLRRRTAKNRRGVAPTLAQLQRAAQAIVVNIAASARRVRAARVSAYAGHRA
jgi:pyroglutamyl-peptidase